MPDATTVSAAVAAELEQHASVVFALMGNGNAWFLDAVVRRGAMDVTLVRHEAATVAAADAHHRASGELAVATTTYGPGFTDAITPLAEAAMARVPLVLVVGDQPTAGPRAWDVDQPASARAVGATTIVAGPGDAAAAARRAAQTAIVERGPVVLAIPYDIAHAEAEAAAAAPAPSAPQRRSSRPTSRSWSERASTSSRPASATPSAQMLAWCRSTCSSARRTRASTSTYAVTPVSWPRRCWPSHAPTVRPTPSLGDRGWAEAGFADVTGSRLDREPGEPVAPDGRLDPRSLFHALESILPADGVIVSDGGHFIGWAPTHLSVADPERLLMVGTALQTIGLGFPSAVGAGVARPESTIVLVSGDGGGLMGMADLESVVREVRHGVVVIVHDAAYGAEVHQYAVRGVAEEPMLIEQVDFSTVARGFGAEAAVIETLDGLQQLEAWLERGVEGVFLADCRVSRDVVAPYMLEVVEAATSSVSQR